MATQHETPAASLVGAVGVFPLPDVLRLIAAGHHTGEVLVVAAGMDGRIWLRDGALTGSAVRGTTTVHQAVFELALIDEGWFYFTGGRSAPEPEPPQSVEAVLRTVAPQVSEWRDLLRRVPLEATISLCASPPGAQVNLSALQWQILATVGSNHPRVVDVVMASGCDQVDVVRTVRDMADAGLVRIGDGTGPSQPPGRPETAEARPGRPETTDPPPGRSGTPDQRLPPPPDRNQPAALPTTPPPVPALSSPTDAPVAPSGAPERQPAPTEPVPTLVAVAGPPPAAPPSTAPPSTAPPSTAPPSTAPSPAERSPAESGAKPSLVPMSLSGDPSVPVRKPGPPSNTPARPIASDPPLPPAAGQGSRPTALASSQPVGASAPAAAPAS